MEELTHFGEKMIERKTKWVKRVLLKSLKDGEGERGEWEREKGVERNNGKREGKSYVYKCTPSYSEKSWLSNGVGS